MDKLKALAADFFSPVRGLWSARLIWCALIVAAVGFLIGWSAFQALAVGATMCIAGMGLSYLARTIAWPSIDLKTFAAKALETSIGAAIVVAAVIVASTLIMVAMMSRANAAETSAVPPQARQYLPTLAIESATHWRASDGRSAPVATMAGMIDHETGCPGMRSCWQPTARFKTSREDGVGFGQFTRAYRADGSLRFDALGELKALYPLALKDANWSTNKYDPALQLRAVVLKLRTNYEHAARLTPHADERLTFATVMHNRGVAGIQNEAAACVMTRGCDRTRWRGHVERTCTASRAVITGTRLSACDISRRYPVDVAKRARTYEGLV
jgi:hypothetical protein